VCLDLMLVLSTARLCSLNLFLIETSISFTYIENYNGYIEPCRSHF